MTHPDLDKRARFVFKGFFLLPVDWGSQKTASKQAKPDGGGSDFILFLKMDCEKRAPQQDLNRAPNRNIRANPLYYCWKSDSKHLVFAIRFILEIKSDPPPSGLACFEAVFWLPQSAGSKKTPLKTNRVRLSRSGLKSYWEPVSNPVGADFRNLFF